MVAKSSNDISCSIVLDISKFSKGVEMVTGKLNTMGGKADKVLASTNRSAEKLNGSFKTMAALSTGVFAGTAALYYANQVRKIADEYQNINARLQLVSKNSKEFESIQKGLYDVSQKTGTSYVANAASFTKLSFAMQNVGATSGEVLRINEMMNKSLVISGASTEEASSFMLQFSQAMGSGVLQGEEFRAMMESNSYFGSLLAKALGTDIAGLRKMSKEGKLTTATLREAFPKMAEEINKAFDKIPFTTQRALTALQNAFNRIIDDSNKASNGTGTISQSILQLAETIDSRREGIISLFSTIISLASSTVSALGNIGQSIAGWDAVSDGQLSFLEFATMDAKELNQWLKKNTTDLREIDGKISELKRKRAEVANSGALTSEGIRSQGSLIDSYNKQIAALEQQKKKIIEVAQASKTQSVSMSENATASWGKITDAAQQSAADQKAAINDALNSMRSQYRGYVNEIKQLQGEIVREEQSTDEKIRDLAREAMSAPDAYEDKKKQAQEYSRIAVAAAQTAKMALDRGDTDKAKDQFAISAEYAEKAKGLYAELGSAVEENDRIIISQTDAIKTAMDGVLESSKIKVEAMKGMQSAAVSAMESIEKKFGLAELEKGIDEAEKKWLKNWEKMKSKAIGDIEKVEDRLVAIKDKEITVWINEKVKKQTGGPVGRFATGGHLPGYGGGDRIPALLEAGEYVIRKEAVASAGLGFLNRLNSLGLSTGGAVSAGSGGDTFNISINYTGAASRADASRMADMVMSELQRRNRRASA